MGEVHDIDGRIAVAHRKLDGPFERGLDVFVRQGHGAFGVEDRIHRASGLRFQGVGDLRHIAERGAHEQEPGARHREQRHLPGPSAIGIGEEMELVHGDVVDIARVAFAQRLVRQDLRRAADDGRVGVDAGVARDHTDVFAAEQLDQVEEFLVDEGFDGSRVIGAAPHGKREEVHRERDHGFARPGGRAQDDVVVHHEAHAGFFLVRPELDAGFDRPVEECVYDLVGRERFAVVELERPASQLAICGRIARRARAVGGRADGLGSVDGDRAFRFGAAAGSRAVCFEVCSGDRAACLKAVADARTVVSSDGVHRFRS